MEVADLDSGSSGVRGSVDNPLPITLDRARIIRLAQKIADLLRRKSKGRSDRSEFMTEYWAIRLVALSYEAVMKNAIFVNEFEVLDFLKFVVAGNRLG